MNKLMRIFTVLLTLTIANSFAVKVDRDGNIGVDRTSSAITLDRGQVALGYHTQVTNDITMIENETMMHGNTPYKLDHYSALNSSFFIGLGLCSVADISLALPLYYEGFQGHTSLMDDLPIEQQYQGDLRYRLKMRLPTPENLPNFSLLVGGTLPTQRAHKGIFPQEIEYYNHVPNEPWTAGRPTFMVTGLMTEVFNDYLTGHVNIGVRNINTASLHNILFTSVAMEFDPLSYLGFFGEVYHERYLTASNPLTVEPTTLSLGAIVKSKIGLDVYGGARMTTGTKYIPVGYVSQDTKVVNTYSMRSAPEAALLFQISWTIPYKKKLKDTDNDGFSDVKDACPTTPGGPCSINGCPVVPKPQPMVMVPPVVIPPVVAPVEPKVFKSIVLNGVNFKTNSYVLLPESYTVLNKELPVLLENPDVNVEVAGHTDNKASLAHNEKLSFNRAKAVAEYFIAHGVDASRLTVKGYNFSVPVETNSTPAGRRANRRVELIQIK